ncbi:MAG: alpha/beta hydrolase [Ferruginibacter sp.]
MKTLILVLSAIMFTTALFAQPRPAEVANIERKWQDTAYANVSPAEKLDIYLPDEGDGPFPVIISIHGGAFLGGDKADDQLSPMLPGLKRGYAVVSINYRLSGEALFPANINDAKAAIRWVKANAATYKLNAQKIALWGSSAGGNLASLAGTSGDVKELEDPTLRNADQSSRVQAVVDWFGPTNFLLMDPQLKETGNGTPDHTEAHSPESKVLGKQITGIAGLVKKANPETYITKDDPAFLIEHGTKDRLVPTQQSVQFAEKLEKVPGKDKVKAVLLEGANHGGPQFETTENLETIFTFLDKNLK